MKNYFFRTKIKEQVENEKVAEIITILRDENFGNDLQRKRFVDLITSLFAIPDQGSRKFIKKLGHACTEIGDEMLKSESKKEANMKKSDKLIKELKRAEARIRKYERILEDYGYEFDDEPIVADTMEYDMVDNTNGEMYQGGFDDVNDDDLLYTEDQEEPIEDNDLTADAIRQDFQPVESGGMDNVVDNDQMVIPVVEKYKMKNYRLNCIKERSTKWGGIK